MAVVAADTRIQETRKHLNTGVRACLILWDPFEREFVAIIAFDASVRWGDIFEVVGTKSVIFAECRRKPTRCNVSFERCVFCDEMHLRCKSRGIESDTISGIALWLFWFGFIDVDQGFKPLLSLVPFAPRTWL
jgi:hypothetical protein